MNKKSSQWSFSGALLYSVIVITTIGYGNIAPRTDWGKMVTILYALMGIPLMLFCLSNIGHAMAHSFKFIYWKCLCYLCVAPKRVKRSRGTQKRKSFRKRRLKASEQFEMRSTVGHHRHNLMYSSHNEHMGWRRSRELDGTPIICNKYALNDEINSRFPGPPPTPSPTSNPPSFQSIMNSALHNYTEPPPKHTNTVRFFADNSSQPVIDQPPPPPMPSPQMVRQMADNSSDESDESDEEFVESSRKNIPITVCLALVISYICGGAWFFSTSEGWTFLDASYFCFVTLSTIGFGDLVPGRTVLSTPQDGQVTLAICALYLLFGMALLAMTLNLVKEKVTTSVRSIGQRIGILVSDDDDDDF